MTMVERVARAIAGNGGDLLACHYKQARAAIEAMREPTEAMVIAAYDRDGLNVGGRPLWKQTVDVQAKVRWSYMINAALSE